MIFDKKKKKKTLYKNLHYYSVILVGHVVKKFLFWNTQFPKIHPLLRMIHREMKLYEMPHL